jgi:hypothetical protein
MCAAAQTVSDGVQTVLRGDYESPARILRPLNENTRSADGAAEWVIAACAKLGRGKISPSYIR